MFGMDMLDVAIGISFVYLLISLLCTAIVEAAEAVLKRRSREVIRVEDLSDEDVAQIAEGRMDRRHDHLDAELK